MDEVIHNPEEKHPDVQHEESDVNVRAIFITGAITLGVFVAVYVGLYFLLNGFESIRRIGDTGPVTRVEAQPAVPPEPRLQVLSTDPVREMNQFLAEEERLLTTYGWTDPSAGVVRIPVERAMELTLQRGFPVQPVAGMQTRVLGSASGRSFVVVPTAQAEPAPTPTPIPGSTLTTIPPNLAGPETALPPAEAHP